MKQLCLSIFCFLTLYPIGFAQQPQVIQYNDREGYPSSYAFGYMMQDKEGWMWFSAGYQVLRYDGHRFRNYPPAEGVVLHTAFNLYQVGDEIWINAIPYMLKVDGDSLRRLDIKNNFLPRAVQSDDISDHLKHHGKDFFLCKNGLYILQGKELIPRITGPDMDLVGGDKLCAFNDSLLLAHDRANNGLVVFNINRKNYYYLQGGYMGLKKYAGKVYIASKGKGIRVLKGIHIRNNAAELHTRLVAGVEMHNPLTKFDIDPQGNLWLFESNEKVFRIKPNGQRQIISEKDDFRDIIFLNSFSDRENNFWVSTFSNLLKIPGQQWDRFTKSDGLLSNKVWFIEKGFEDNQILITSAKGMNIYDQNKIWPILSNGKPVKGNFIRFNGNRIFYFMHNQFLSAEWNPSTFECTNKKVLAQFPMPVISVAYDKEDNYFLSTFDGLHVYKGNKAKRLSNTSYMRLFIDSRGNLWAGKFFLELDCYRIQYHDSFPRIEHMLKMDSVNKEMPRVNGIRAIAEGPGGHILVGTRYNGLFVLTLKNEKVVQVRHFNPSHGLGSNNVWDLSMDNKGVCWIATSGGVNSLHYKEGKWILKDESKRRQIKGIESILASADNKIWVNSYPGIVSFNPDKNDTLFPYAVAITGIHVNGKEFTPGEENQFNANENDFSIEFSANTYQFENEVAYSWRLKEDDEWSAPSNSHTIHFSELKPGNYAFSVKAQDAFGQWSRNRAGFQFTIVPPLWGQAWFILIIALLLISILYLIYRYRIAQLKKVENLRSHIARDLHDEIGSALTGISILSKVSQHNLHTDKNKSELLLQKVIDQSRKMQQDMSDIVWAIKPGNDRIENMVVHMREYLAKTLEPAEIAFQLSADESLLHKALGMQSRRDFFLIFKEAINNVVKHAQAQQVSISLFPQEEWIHLKICDDGKGLNGCNNESGNGLQNMKERAASLKGRLEIYEREEGGCCMEMKIPGR